MYLHTVIMDKAPEAAAVCISALPLYDSPSVARYGSSCIIAYNDVTKYYIHTYMCIYTVLPQSSDPLETKTCSDNQKFWIIKQMYIK